MIQCHVFCVPQYCSYIDHRFFGMYTNAVNILLVLVNFTCLKTWEWPWDEANFLHCDG